MALGNTVVIEDDVEVGKTTDWIIHLGPEGTREGGEGDCGGVEIHGYLFHNSGSLLSH